MRGGREHLDRVAAAIDDREQPSSVGRGILDVADARMISEPRNHIQREIRALELGIGVDHHGNVDRVRDAAEVGFDLRVGERKIRFEDREDAVGAEFLIGAGLRDRIGRRGGDHAGDHGHTAFCRCDRRAHHGGALVGIEIGEFAGRTERRQSVHAGLDQIIAKPGENILADVAGRIDRGDEIGEDAVEVGHDCPLI
jgi:hypothetical protein